MLIDAILALILIASLGHGTELFATGFTITPNAQVNLTTSYRLSPNWYDNSITHYCHHPANTPHQHLRPLDQIL